MGAALLRELVDRGHSVTAVVRRHDAVKGSGASEALADVYDQPALERALAGADAVVSVFNPGWTEPGLYDKYMEGSRSIQAATKAAGVPRLLVLGGAGSLIGTDGRQLIESMTVPEPYAAGVRAARDYYAELQPETGLDWVFLSPPMGYGPMGPTERRGTYRTGIDHPLVDDNGDSAISGADLALAIVDEIERPRHHQQRFTVAY